ncbi:MAG: hypothetical protein IKE21_08405 [Erysipelotrichaceae bacterium]|nr:hypothetical protein [Erysipelotrichaceae bacterium]
MISGTGVSCVSSVTGVSIGSGVTAVSVSAGSSSSSFSSAGAGSTTSITGSIVISVSSVSSEERGVSSSPVVSSAISFSVCST